MTTHVNMLPAGFQRRQSVLLSLRRWTLPWMLVAGSLAAGVVLLPVGDGVSTSAQQDAADREEARLEKLTTRLSEAQLQLADMQSQENLVWRLDTQPPELLTVAVVSSACAECEGATQVENLVLQRSEMGTTNQDDVAAPGSRYTLTLEGSAVDNHSVAKLSAALKKAGLFSSVELKSSGIEHLGDQEVTSFVLECDF
jgi:hypothetical protein